MKNLVIVESPAKAKTIERYLGKDYIVKASMGHIRDLATSGKDGLGIDIENEFKPTYEVIKGKNKTINELKSNLSKVDNVYLASDPDREGEAIAWHLAKVLNIDLDNNNRVEFHEITKNAVNEAFQNPRKVDIDLVKSQESRRMLDRILGFKLSKILQKKIASKSAGRVQSVALKLICDREKDIAAFVPEEFWTINANFHKDNKDFIATLTKYQNKDISNKELADELVNKSTNPFTVTKITNKKRNKSLSAVFSTSTLQQECSTKLGFSSKKTMKVAQELYEGIAINGELTGLITYMRTDSTRISNVFINDAMKLIEANYGKEYVGFYNQKVAANAQDAHEGIRPTHVELNPEEIKDQLTNDQYKLYRFIYYRALACLMAPSKYADSEVTLTTNDLNYLASGTQLIFDGYLKVYSSYEKNKDTILPTLVENEQIDAKSIEPKQHFTEPPLRYSEARLIKEMEKNGIGRPSTYATIIEKIQTSRYVELKKEKDTSKTKVFFPTEQGSKTSESLDKYFSQLINVSYTSKMETDLDMIADGKVDYLSFLKDFYADFEPTFQNAMETWESKYPIPTDEICPECGKNLVIRLSKKGEEFYGCSGFPKCRYAKPMNNEEPEIVSDEKCPDCGSDLIYRIGRFGKFIACSNYPTCKYSRNLKEKTKEEPVILDELCPKCGKPLAKRKNYRGKYFIGCTGYPKCRYIKGNVDEG